MAEFAGFTSRDLQATQHRANPIMGLNKKGSVDFWLARVPKKVLVQRGGESRGRGHM